MNIESATMMILRTGISQCAAEVSLARAKEMECEICSYICTHGSRDRHMNRGKERYFRSVEQNKSVKRVNFSLHFQET